ncbi:solute carrier family 28 member 3-like isoform X2 [Branchiostoma floridae]|uniref:Sodium/nucleoside cotransporter n=1 Tax=Branchiostoma floridae TaxID=7739 RepID=A0A9J7KQW1_BRAFL|nr:solute carrier family 28 member 3-like isoform X2 [Branchiostoma floridae]
MSSPGGPRARYQPGVAEGRDVVITLDEKGSPRTEVAGDKSTAAQCYKFTKTDPDSVHVQVEPTAPAQETPPPAYNDTIDTEDAPSRRTKCCGGPSMSTRVLRVFKEHKKPILISFGSLLLIGFIVFLGFAIDYYLKYGLVPDGCKNLIGLVSITGAVLFLLAYYCISRFCGDDIYEHCLKHCFTVMGNIWVKRVFYVLCLIGLILWIALDTARNTQNLISGAGLIVMVIFLYIFSKHPDHVKWRPVLWGLALQFIFGLLILRTQVGFDVFRFMGEKFQSFIEYADVGSKFVFGEKYTDHFFAFKVLPIIVFFSSVMSVLYYIGVMQVVIVKMAWLLQRTMETSSPESINAAGNIFVGQTDAPLLIRPLIKNMTKSELHAVMTGGFATIAGSVLGAYIAFGVPPTHLLTASVMSAPAALAVSKLFYPETEETMRLDDNVELGKGDERNVIEAVAQGSQIAISLVANIAVNLISFLALLAFFNGILSWVGCMVGYEILSFEIICSYVFMPLAFMMGVEWKDCRLVAELIGIKTFLNEFVAYEALAKIINNRVTGADGVTMTVRSEVIATYALCGFSNIGAIGVQIGGIGALAPERRGDIADMALRALVAGSIACFMTASLAGMLYQEPAAMIMAATNATLNATLNATANPNATVLPTVFTFLTSPNP